MNETNFAFVFLISLDIFSGNQLRPNQFRYLQSLKLVERYLNFCLFVVQGRV